MSQYLRDESLKNLSLSESALTKINDDFQDMENQINKNLDMKSTDENIRKKISLLSYIIRFDNKGFKLFSFDKALKHFQDAHHVERFIFVLESVESIRTNRLAGKSIELWLDAGGASAIKLTVQDDDISWVDSVFCRIRERLNKYRNKNFIIQNRWIPFVVQLLGVIAGFIISLWAAIKISPKLAIENSIAFTFVIAFLLFSNIWTLLYEGILRCLNYFWPSISFKEKGNLHWLIKALISSAFVGIFLFIINRIFLYLSNIMKVIIKE